MTHAVTPAISLAVEYAGERITDGNYSLRLLDEDGHPLLDENNQFLLGE